MKFSIVLGGAAALVCFADVAAAKAPAEIAAITKAVTVEIKLTKAKAVGSGVIVRRQGNLYTLVTNRHVVLGSDPVFDPQETYLLNLGGKHKLLVPATAVKFLGQDLDLALIQFRSSHAHSVAQFASSLRVDEQVFAAGYPFARSGFSFFAPSSFSFNEGKAIAFVNKRLAGDGGGYTVIYNARTQPGMSGGGVFNQAGELVAIHGMGDRYRANTLNKDVLSAKIQAQAALGSKIGYNRGIPVRWVVTILSGLTAKQAAISSGQGESLAIAKTADEHFIAGFNKWLEPGNDVLAGKKAALQELSQAIKLNPRYMIAYFMRALVYEQLSDPAKAVADYNQTIAINPKFADAYNNRGLLKDEKFNDVPGALADYGQTIALYPQFAYAYYNRGNLKYRKLQDYRGALADYNQAILLDPQNAAIYVNRGALKYQKLQDSRGALADFDKSLTINPEDAIAYYNRARLKNELGDFAGAVADFDRVVAITPNDENAYYRRGVIKKNQLNDFSGALTDFNKAIGLNPQYADAYYSRGSLKIDRFKDATGALADLNKAIVIDPQMAMAYGTRGFLKYTQLNDRSGAIADMRQAAKLARVQNDAQILKMARQTLQEWGVSE
jgi:tetratricopeptide (TPR) repeat protein